MIVVPERFVADLVRVGGEEARAWAAALPHLVSDMVARWGLAVDGAPMHGGLGLVLPVLRGVEACALKIAWADTTGPAEVLALRTWNGAGAVRLLDEEAVPGEATRPGYHVLLLERLDSSKTLADVPLETAVRTAGSLLRRLSVPAPDGVPLLRDRAAAYLSQLPRLRALGATSGVPVRHLDAAGEIAKTLGPAAGRLLVHDDLHYDNVLAGTRESWLAVDPKVVAGDPEYAVGPLLWCRLDPAPGTDDEEDEQAYAGPVRDHVVPVRLDLLVASAGLDPQRAWGWAVFRCVEYALWGTRHGLTYDPARCRAIIGRLLEVAESR